MSTTLPGGFKSSGVEWIGDVPIGWDVCALNHRFAIALGKMLDEKKITGRHLAPYLRNVDVQWGRINTDGLPEMDFAAQDRIRYSLVPGDLLVCEGGEVGRAAVWDGRMEECYYQKALHRLRPRDPRRDDAWFLFYCLYAAANLGVFAGSEGRSTIAHLTAEALRRYRFPFPPLSEQTAIVSFLGRETRKIEGLIAEQTRLIELLNEERQAVIARAVTKGLNPQIRMKESDVEWLGRIPKHWQAVRLGVAFAETAESGNDDLPVLSVSIHHGVSDKEFDEDELERKVSRSEDRSKYIRVEPEDLVYNMMRAWQGAFGTVKVAGMVSPAYVVARPRFEICTEFVEYLLRTPQAIEELRRHSHGVTDFRLRLYWDEFKAIKIALPSLDEQRAILEFISTEAGKIDALIAESDTAIALLQERRMALISTAVTGRIDVRGIEVVKTTPRRTVAA